MPTHSKAIPDGFRVATWDSLPVNAIVYRRENHRKAFRVTDPRTRSIVPIGETTTFIVSDADLLVRNGPFIVIVTQDSEFVAVYSDLEFDVYVAGLDTSARVTRPLACDSLTHLTKQELDELHEKSWPGLFGQWSIVKATSNPAQVSFDLGNMMAASALVVDLLRNGKRFAVEPNREKSPTYFTFTVPTDVLAWIQQMRRDC
jgi:hypothetical protein